MFNVHRRKDSDDVRNCWMDRKLPAQINCGRFLKKIAIVLLRRSTAQICVSLCVFEAQSSNKVKMSVQCFNDKLTCLIVVGVFFKFDNLIN